MKAKYARQIRNGITKARLDINLARMGLEPMFVRSIRDSLAMRAYDMTLLKETVKQATAVQTFVERRTEHMVRVFQGQLDGNGALFTPAECPNAPHPFPERCALCGRSGSA